MSSAQSRQTPQLKWHNTNPESFSARRAASSSNYEAQTRASPTLQRKRQSTSSEQLSALATGGGGGSGALHRVPGTEDGSSPSLSRSLTSPTKRHRLSAGNEAPAKTPTKSSRLPAVPGDGSESGMQTPPPSSTGVARRRGRPPSRSTSLRTTSRARSSAHQSPSKSRANRWSQPGLRAVENHQSAATQKTLFWDDGLASNESEHTQFDWNSLRNNLFQNGMFAPGSSLQKERSGSPVFTDAPSDSAHYSFIHSDRSDIVGNSVNPSRIFSEPSSATSSMLDGADGRPSHERPYHHQYLQTQREKEMKERRRKSYHGSSDDARRSSRGKQAYAPLLSIPTAFRRSSSIPRSEVPPLTPRGHKGRGKGSPTKSTRTRTEVKLEISPGGRAKAQTVVVHECDPNGGEDESDSEVPDESDSSFDGDTPRGLAPDGSKYLYFRRGSDRSRDVGPSAGTRSATRMLHSDMTPTTPQKTVPGSFGGGVNGLDPSSSPRLPTPFKSSPPASYNQLLQFHSARVADSQATEVEGEGSEAETVMDESLEARLVNNNEEPSDAAAALRQVLGRNRRGRGGVRDTPTKSRPNSAAKPYLARSHSVGSASRVIASDTFTSSPARRLFDASASTPRKSLRRRPPADGGFHKKHSAVSTTTAAVDGLDCETEVEELEGEETSSETRCLCGKVNDSGKTMVQCDSCKYWLHVRCLGYSRKTLPQVFVCEFCIEQRPQGKGRTRGLTRAKSASAIRREKRGS